MGEKVAERVGFEPTAHCCVTGFQDQLLKPLGHLSESSVDILPWIYCFVKPNFTELLRIVIYIRKEGFADPEE